MIKHTLSIEGNTKSDKAIEMWMSMNPMEKFEIMGKVRDYKSIERKNTACINYIFENLV